MKTAIITGVTGQDGAYLVQHLLGLGYRVIGTYRRTSSVNFWRLEELGLRPNSKFHLVEYDLTDMGTTIRLLEKWCPDELYNLAAQSFVGVSFDQPHTTAQITGIGVLNILEAIRIVNPKIKFYQASTSEMFGLVQAVPQRESTPFYPRSPYGVAKLYAHWLTVNYRESYDLFAASGILFNHESPLRGKEFVTRKITDSLAKVKLGVIDSFELGNLDAKRDWGFAKEYVVGMWKMLQVDKPGNYVLATNKTTTVRDFVAMAARAAGLKIEFHGSDVSEHAVNCDTGKTILRVSSAYYRPSEVDLLIGDPTLAKEDLQWEPETSLDELCALMVEADIRRNKKGASF